MKNLFLSCAMACAAAVFIGINQTQAQDLKPHFGITAGADLTTLGSSTYRNTSFNYQWRYGFQGGIYADLPLAKHFSIMPQVLYSQKGGKVDAKIPNLLATSGSSGSAGNSPSTAYDNYTGSVRMNYIDVPVLLAYKPLADLSFFAGPQISFLLAQHSSFADMSVSGGTLTHDDTTNGFKKTLLGGNVGVGYNLCKEASVHLHYMFDLQHVADKDASSAGANPPKNSGFALTLSYLF